MFEKYKKEKNMIQEEKKENFKTLMTTETTAQLLGCTARKLEADRIKGGGIPYIKVGRSVRYNMIDIEGYIRRNTYTSTSGGKPNDA